MRFVPRAEIRPGRCQVIPFIANDHEAGFVDTGTTTSGWDDHVYVSVVAVREMAREVPQIGLVPKGELDAALERADELERRVADLELQIREADKELGAIYTLKNKDWSPSKKPGRPPKQKAA